MNANEQLIHHFYTCFKNKDYKGMQQCYAPHAVFNDSVFKSLNAAQVKSMWEMLILKGKDLTINFNHISADEQYGTAHWDADYTFSATGRKVINHIDASFEFENGKIIKHTDHFDFHTWAKQALGLTGFLLGSTSFLQRRITKQAMKNLAQFMAKRS